MEWDSYKESPIYDAESYMTALKKRYLECYTSHSCYLTGSNISRSDQPAHSPRLAGSEENVVLEKDPSFKSEFRGLRRRSYEMMIAFGGGGVEKCKDKTPTPMLSPGEVFLNSEIMSPEICSTPTEVSPGVIASSPHPKNASPDLDDRSSPVSFTTSPPQHLVSSAPHFDSNKMVPPKLVVQRRALPHITFSPRATLTSEEDGSAKFSGYTTPSGSVFDSPEPQLKHQPDLGSVQSAQRVFSNALMGCSQLSPMINSTNLSPKRSPNPFSKVKYKENASDISGLNQIRVISKDNRRKIRPLSAYQYFKKSHNVDFNVNHKRSKSIDDSDSKYNLSNHLINSKSDHVPKLNRTKCSSSTNANKFNRSWTSSSDYNIVPEKEKSLTRSKSCCSARSNAINTGVGGGRNYRGRESKHRVFRMDGDCRVLFPNFTVSYIMTSFIFFFI